MRELRIHARQWLDVSVLLDAGRRGRRGRPGEAVRRPADHEHEHQSAVHHVRRHVQRRHGPLGDPRRCLPGDATVPRPGRHGTQLGDVLRKCRTSPERPARTVSSPPAEAELQRSDPRTGGKYQHLRRRHARHRHPPVQPDRARHGQPGHLQPVNARQLPQPVLVARLERGLRRVQRRLPDHQRHRHALWKPHLHPLDSDAQSAGRRRTDARRRPVQLLLAHARRQLDDHARRRGHGRGLRRLT